MRCPPAPMLNVAVLLYDRDDDTSLAEAEQWWRRAADTGAP
ncbi:MAG TPA: hypothetical protein VFI46_17275 [Jiangellaceae bacterium]|nr:hypothetical protein [Jiangellaceae bacterium]